MEGILDWLFGTEGFPPRWSCGTAWREEPALGWIHVVADGITWLSYSAIPLVLVYFVFRRRDVEFPKVFWLFSAFVFCCGAVHAIEVVIFWEPVYRLSAVFKGMTALVSAVTVIALIKVLPHAISLPGLAVVNDNLRREVEHRKEAEGRLGHYSQRLQASNEDLERFAYGASHDLSAPLRNIQLLTKWLREEESQGMTDRGRELLGIVERRADRMQTLLHDLLQYSRAGRDLGAPESVDTRLLAHNAATLLEPPAGFKVHCAEDLPTLRTVPTPLSQVLMNLVSNALKHHDREAGNVWIGAQPVAGAWRFEVTDDGPGIPESQRQMVFEMFHTLRPKDQVEGSGMGLALVRKLVHRMGGEVGIGGSDGERGTTVWFTWPESGDGEGKPCSPTSGDRS